MHDQTPSVAFVILNWNQAELTAMSLRSVLAQDYPNAQVIVVDNGSTDSSVNVLRQQFPTVTFIANRENLGYSAGNNIGIREALARGADYVCLLNNDTEIDRNMLTVLINVAESDTQIGIVGPTMYFADPPDVLWGGENRIDWRGARMVRQRMGEVVAHPDQPPRAVDYIDSCALLIKRNALERIGLMDSRYFINFDDADLNWRARQAGFTIVYAPSARMWHKVSATMGQASAATTYYMTRNALLFFAMHAPGVWRLLAPLQIMWRTLRTIGAWTFKAQYRTDAFRRKRDANLYALRDFCLRRVGCMGVDVARVCFDR